MRPWAWASPQGVLRLRCLPPPDSPSAPVNVTVRHLKANSAVVSWDVLEDEVVIGFAISQQVTLWEGRSWWVREAKEKD